MLTLTNLVSFEVHFRNLTAAMSRLLLLLSLVATASSYVLPAARVAQRSATHRAPVVVLQVFCASAAPPRPTASG